MNSNTKRKLDAVAGGGGDKDGDEDGNGKEPPSKRIKEQGGKDASRGGEADSGKGAARSSNHRAGGLPQKHPVNVQNGIYAAERLSCSLDVTHSINFILLGENQGLISPVRRAYTTLDFTGSKIYITWSDRQNLIRTGSFDIVDNLPHFLLVLLILQRFDLARWGFFTEFPESSVKTIGDIHRTHVLKATFTDDPVDIYPEDDPVYDGINLAGRSTSIAGARKSDGHPERLTNSEDIRKANDLVAKFSWPEETRLSEVVFIQRAKEIGESNDLVKGHIPTILGSIDPPHLTCSTSLIRQFLGLDTNGARSLRVIISRRLQEIKYLDEEDLLLAFLDCFLCERFLSPCNVMTLIQR